MNMCDEQPGISDAVAYAWAERTITQVQTELMNEERRRDLLANIMRSYYLWSSAVTNFSKTELRMIADEVKLSDSARRNQTAAIAGLIWCGEVIEDIWCSLKDSDKDLVSRFIKACELEALKCSLRESYDFWLGEHSENEDLKIALKNG